MGQSGWKRLAKAFRLRVCGQLNRQIAIAQQWLHRVKSSLTDDLLAAVGQLLPRKATVRLRKSTISDESIGSGLVS